MSVSTLKSQWVSLPLLQGVVKSAGKYSQGLPSIASKVGKIVVGTFAIFALANAPQSAAGPVAYAACLAECSALTLGGFIPACIAACLPVLAAPTP